MLSIINKFKDMEKDNDRVEMLENIRKAHEQWKEREIFFREVSDPDLVDYAIFQLEASRLKYIYLLKKYREEINDTSEIDLNNMEVLS